MSPPGVHCWQSRGSVGTHATSEYETASDRSMGVRWCLGGLSRVVPLREERRLQCALRFWHRELSLDWFRPPWPCQWLPCRTCRSHFKFMDVTTTTLTT